MILREPGERGIREHQRAVENLVGVDDRLKKLQEEV
jgi:hypothetical protein